MRVWRLITSWWNRNSANTTVYPKITGDKVGIGTNNAQALLHIAGTPGSLSQGWVLGDGDSGAAETSDDIIGIFIGGDQEFRIQNGNIQGLAPGYFEIATETSGSATVPVYRFNGFATGMGRLSTGELTNIVNSVQGTMLSEYIHCIKVGQSINRTDAGAADYNPSALTSDYLITADNTAAPRAITISTEDVQSGTAANPRTFVIADEYGNSTAKNITITLENGGTINGQASAVINLDYDTITIYCTGTNAFIY
jgi:hypothetical protein